MVGAASELAEETRAASATPGFTATAERVDGVRLRYHSPPCACRALDRRRGELTIELDRPGYGVAPGQTACLLDGELVVGHGTIARSESCRDR